LGDIPVKRISITCVLTAILCATTGFAQEAAPPVFDLAKMEQVLKDAGELQSAQPEAVAEKLNPLLAELRRLRQKGALQAETSKAYQEALLLMMRTQAILFASEDEIKASLRELLALHPKIDDSIFNPLEKQLLEKVRSAETGTLSLKTNPPECSVRYQGTELGVTPLDIPLIAGSYPLTLQKTGYIDQNFEAAIKPSEILMVDRSLRRRAVDLPLSVNVPGASVFVNGQQAGSSQPYDVWLATVPVDRRQDYSTLIAQWKLDPVVANFFRIPDVTIGETIKVEFRAPCYESLTLNVSVKEQDVADWNRPLVGLPELRFVELKKDIGFMEVSSSPIGGEAWIDGVLQGKTPMSKDFCSGMHRVQVVHPSGQYVQEVNVRRGQAVKVQGELKPAIAFLGVYGKNSESAPLSPIVADWERAAKGLYLRVTAFSNPQVPMEEIEALRKKGNLAVERLLDPKSGYADLDAVVKKAAAEAGRADMILIGQKTGDKYQFRLFSTIHPIPDIIDIPNLEESALDFVISQFNKVEQVAARLQTPNLGLDLLDSPKGLIVLKAPAGANQALARGAVLRSVDQKPRNFKELQDYLRTRKPGQQLSFEVISAKDAATTVPVPIQFIGAEYPWSMPDSFSNAILVMLHHLMERDPLSDQAKFASLSLARGLMLQGEWKPALEVLAKTNLEPLKSGICPGTVLYLQARAYEELGDRALAESYYARTKDYPDATVGTFDGLPVRVLAEQRMQLLKKAR
jgi:hypothetical protein